MTKHKEYVNGKLRNVEYSSLDSKCNRRWCFQPYNGNGRAICRRYEIGNCTGGKTLRQLVAIKAGKKMTASEQRAVENLLINQRKESKNG